MSYGSRISSASLRPLSSIAVGLLALWVSATPVSANSPSALDLLEADATPTATRADGSASVDALVPQVLALSDAPAQDALTPRLFQTGAGSNEINSRMRIYSTRTRTGALHIHGGAFRPIDANALSANLGARLGINIGSPILFGVSGGWTHYTKNLLQPVSSELPGIEPKTILATASAQLLPAMVFMQATLTEQFFLVPYVGIGAGYEWLFLRAQDFRDGSDTKQTYKNWGWEWYAGAGLKISQGLRVDGEAFYNGALLKRDVVDTNGVGWTETLDLAGVGARIGLHITY
jgi:opacity protein-like surface antigen